MSKRKWRRDALVVGIGRGCGYVLIGVLIFALTLALSSILQSCANLPSQVRVATAEEVALVEHTRAVWATHGQTDPCPFMDDVYIAELPVADLMDWCVTPNPEIKSCVYLSNKDILDIPGSMFIYMRDDISVDVQRSRSLIVHESTHALSGCNFHNPDRSHTLHPEIWVEWSAEALEE